MRKEIEAEGGTVEKFIGDAVMAAFGVPTAHEDDPARALRASLRMQRQLALLNDQLERTHGTRLQVRIGINTGEVIAVTDPRQGEAMATGDASTQPPACSRSRSPDTSSSRGEQRALRAASVSRTRAPARFVARNHLSRRLSWSTRNLSAASAPKYARRSWDATPR
jgi:Adenylate and Guanylate cyclase catalytic domain